jgi:hypothetical protein
MLPNADVQRCMQNLEGQTSLELASVEEVQRLLRDPESAKDFVQ